MRKCQLQYLPRRWRHTLVQFFDFEFWLSFLYQFTFCQTITDIGSTLTTLIHHHYLHQQTRVHNSVKVFVRIMALFSTQNLGRVFCANSLFFNIITGIALKLTTLFHHHNQQTRVHNSVKFLLRIMAPFRFRILVKLFIPNQFFSKQFKI